MITPQQTPRKQLGRITLAVLLTGALLGSAAWVGFAADPVLRNWSNTSVYYRIGDLVNYQGNTYKALIAHGSSYNDFPPNDTAKWQVQGVTAPVESGCYQSWNSANAYPVGSIVTYNGVHYQNKLGAITVGSGNPTQDLDTSPNGSSTTHWINMGSCLGSHGLLSALPSTLRLTCANGIPPTWNSGTSYPAGAAVLSTSGSWIVVAKRSTQGETTDSLDNILPASSPWIRVGNCGTFSVAWATPVPIAPTAAPTAVPTATPVPPTGTPAPTPTPTATPVPGTPTPTPVVTAAPTSTPAPTATPTPTPVPPTAAPTTPPTASIPGHTAVVSTFYTYDALGRLWTIKDANGYVTTFEYDANGNRKKRTDALGHITSYTYDALNRLATMTDANGKVTTFGYDANDHLVTVTDPEGFTTTYTYDGLDNLRKIVSPDTGSTTYIPDVAGRTGSKIDARGKTAAYTYDNLGRIKTVTYGDQTHTYTYDSAPNGIGQLAGFSDADGSTTYSYDPLGRISQSSRTATVSGSSLTQRVGYGWSANNRLNRITYPSGREINYSWTNGALTAVQIGSQPLASNIQWSSSIGAQSFTYGNGQLWARSSDNTGRIAGLALGDTIRSHGFDNVGNIKTINDLARPQLNQNFNYDNLDRLTLGNVGGIGYNYTYDDNGNRTSENHGSSTTLYNHAATNNRLNKTTGSNPQTYSHDPAGNRLNDNNGLVNTYNDAGRISQITRSGITTQYNYNALGQRTQKTNPNGTTRFVYDEAGHLLGEYTANGTPIQETVWLGDTPIAVLKPTADPANPKVYYVWADQLGTPRQITDPANNQLVWRWDSEAFGNTQANQDPGNTGTQFVYNLRFPGQYYDAESGRHYNYFRDYDPSTGRYVQSDPIGLAGGSFSTYGYVGGSPIVNTDSQGLFLDTTGAYTATSAAAGSITGTSAAVAGAGISVAAIGGVGIGLAFNYSVEQITGRSPGAHIYDLLHPAAINQLPGGNATTRAPYTHLQEREARSFQPDPFACLGGGGKRNHCDQLANAINVLRAQIAWRKTDLNPKSPSYQPHLKHIADLQKELERLERAHRDICG